MSGDHNILEEDLMNKWKRKRLESELSIPHGYRRDENEVKLPSVEFMFWTRIVSLFILMLALFFLAGCVSVPPAPPGTDTGRIMGYAPKGDFCSGKAAHRKPVVQTGLCYDESNLQRWCQAFNYAGTVEDACAGRTPSS